MNLLTRARLALPRVAHARPYSSAQVDAELVLARDWIAESLYHPTYGYFNTEASPVGQLPEQLPFTHLYGQQEYLQHLRQWYDKLQTSWLTPAEIFHPFYGHAVAKAVLQNLSNGDAPMDIIEDHLQTQAPAQYKNCSYTSLEISTKLAKIQQQKVLADGEHAEQYKVLQQDAIGSSIWSTIDPKPCVILVMEVLDNLPHDRVWRHSTEAEWQETWVQASSNAEERFPKEVMQPVADASVWACLELAQQEQQHLPTQSWLHGTMDWILGQVSPSGHATEQILWLPTACLQLLQRIGKARPNHLIIAGDFDELPEVAVPGQAAPLVASTVNGQTLDHNSYLVPKGTADIFFPTNFQLLQRLHQLANKQHSEIHGQIMKTRSFMEQYADVQATCTRSGYNPLLHDFTNTSFFIGRGGSFVS